MENNNYKRSEQQLDELVARYVELEDQMDDLLSSGSFDAADMDIQQLLSKKLDSCCRMLQAYQNREKSIAEEISRLEARLEAVEERKQSLSDSISGAMMVLRKKKLESDLYTITLRKGSGKLVIDDEESVPKEFWVIPKPKAKIDKTALKKTIDADNPPSYCHIDKTPSLKVE